jgi:hypothetical protein
MEDIKRNELNGELVRNGLPPEEESYRGWIYRPYAHPAFLWYWVPDKQQWRVCPSYALPLGEIRKFCNL